MTKQQESEILTRVGPGTPMGNVLRHYWFPALKSSELVPDVAPVVIGRIAISAGVPLRRTSSSDHTGSAEPSPAE